MQFADWLIKSSIPDDNLQYMCTFLTYNVKYSNYKELPKYVITEDVPVISKIKYPGNGEQP